RGGRASGPDERRRARPRGRVPEPRAAAALVGARRGGPGGSGGAPPARCRRSRLRGHDPARGEPARALAGHPRPEPPGDGAGGGRDRAPAPAPPLAVAPLQAAFVPPALVVGVGPCVRLARRLVVGGGTLRRG